MSGASMRGPFFTERAMLLRLSLHDELVRAFVVARLVTESRLTPRRHGVIPLHSALTATVWVIHRIHDDAANRWTEPPMARAAGFSDRNVFVIKIPNLSDRRHAIDIDQPYFPGWQLHVGITGFLGDQLRGSSRTASHLRTFTRTQFDVMNRRAQRDVLKRHCIAHQDVGVV